MNASEISSFDMNSEEYANRNSAKIFLAVWLIIFICSILNELEFFYIPKSHMRSNFLLITVIAVSLLVIAYVPKISQNPKTKYVILLGAVLTSFAVLTALNFHAALMLCLPMLVAVNYHSRGLSVMTLIGTLVCALFSPAAGYLLGTWQESYFAMLLYVTNPEYASIPGFASMSGISGFIASSGLSPVGMILAFVALPQTFFALFFGILVIVSSWRKRQKFEMQLKQANESRDSILAGIADIVENRDSNTGGHIKRTSAVIQILIQAMRKNPKYKSILSEDYSDCIVKTAPMHDLGKIAIPDAILNKPSRLSPEEFEYIKIHPQKSYEIVKSILQGLNDEKLMQVAENIALYHHEKYDGTGYPKGLKGEEIPLEARLMAIADVYDALVSKRCYKESMPQEKAYSIISESMGTHFDANLRECFDAAYPEIVKFYNSLDIT